MNAVLWCFHYARSGRKLPDIFASHVGAPGLSELTEEQRDFLQVSIPLIRARGKAFYPNSTEQVVLIESLLGEMMAARRKEGAVQDPFFWISQLYDDDDWTLMGHDPA